MGWKGAHGCCEAGRQEIGQVGAWENAGGSLLNACDQGGAPREKNHNTDRPRKTTKTTFNTQLKLVMPTQCIYELNEQKKRNKKQEKTPAAGPEQQGKKHNNKTEK